MGVRGGLRSNGLRGLFELARGRERAVSGSKDVAHTIFELAGNYRLLTDNHQRLVPTGRFARFGGIPVDVSSGYVR